MREMEQLGSIEIVMVRLVSVYLAVVNMARVNAENINMNDRTLKCGLIFICFFRFICLSNMRETTKIF